MVVTIEPYSIHSDQIEDTYDLEEDRGSTDDNTYIVDIGEQYALYVNDELIARFDNIPEEFKDYPVYTEKPEDGK